MGLVCNFLFVPPVCKDFFPSVPVLRFEKAALLRD